MKLICAWCGVPIDRPEYRRDLEPATSHGMCSSCSKALSVQEHGASLQQHLDTIPVPVLLIDDHSSVVTMNVRASDILGKKSNEEATQLFGRVFDCIHSRTLEGCGRNIHCAGCTIRRSVRKTFDTGEPQVAIPATLSVTNPDDISEAVLAVTTVKIGELVVLRID